jgi:hypothetical protein
MSAEEVRCLLVGFGLGIFFCLWLMPKNVSILFIDGEPESTGDAKAVASKE